MSRQQQGTNVNYKRLLSSYGRHIWEAFAQLDGPLGSVGV